MSDPNRVDTATDLSWTVVVAVSNNGVIGRGDALPWKMRSDLQRFKCMTMGHCLLMGRKTYESIGRPLPGRQTIVLSRNGATSDTPGYRVANDLSQVASLIEPGRRVMVVGGAEVYRQTLGASSGTSTEYCSTLWLTRVLADIAGDTYFPEISWSQWQLQSSQSCAAGAHDDWPSEFQVWTRRSPST